MVVFPFINEFLSALRNVGKQYMSYTVTINNKPEIKYSERVFAYEFYHQLRSVIPDKDAIISGEQEKDGRLFMIENAGYHFIPDLVLHSSIESIGEQYWICEIKMLGNRTPFVDLGKIHNYVQKNVRFNNYIFLFVGAPLDCVKKKMFNYIKKHLDGSLYDNTICIFYHRDSNDQPQIETILLGDIIKEAKEHLRTSNR